MSDGSRNKNAWKTNKINTLVPTLQFFHQNFLFSFPALASNCEAPACKASTKAHNVRLHEGIGIHNAQNVYYSGTLITLHSNLFLVRCYLYRHDQWKLSTVCKVCKVNNTVHSITHKTLRKNRPPTFLP